MTHVQQLTLNAVQTAIALAAVVPAGRVYLDRVDPLQPSELPCICITEDGPELVDYLGQEPDGFYQKRTLDVQVCCVVAPGATAADARTLGLAVEQALQRSTVLRWLMAGYQISSSDYEQSGVAERLFNQRVQRWQFTYTANSNDPTKFI